MAILTFHGFETGDEREVQTGSGTVGVSSTVSKTGGYSLYVNPPTTTTSRYKPVSKFSTAGANNGTGTGTTTMGFSFQFRVDLLPASGDEIIAYWSWSLGSTIELRIDSTGVLKIYTSTTLMATGTTVLSTGQFYRISGKLTTGVAPASTYLVNIDGVSELSGSPSSQWHNVLYGDNFGGFDIGKRTNRNSNLVEYYYDDVIMDDADEPGDWRVSVATPISNGTTMQWTSGTGASNYTQVDDIPIDSATYVKSSGAAGQIALFRYQTLSTIGAKGVTIKSLKMVSNVRDDVEGTSSGFVRIVSNGTTLENAAGRNQQAVDSNTSFLLANTDPSGGGAWTEARFDAVEAGAREANAVAQRGLGFLMMALTTPYEAAASSITGDSTVVATAGVSLAMVSSSLTGDSSVVASVTTIELTSASIGGDSSVVADVYVITEVIEVDKTFTYKVYNTDNVFVGQWNDVVSDFTYSQEINSAGSSIDVVLARNSDYKEPTLGNLLDNNGDPITTQDSLNINTIERLTDSVGPGSNVILNYNVDIYIYYGSYGELSTEDNYNLTTESGDLLEAQKGTPDGSIIFQGYISKYVSRYGGDEKTTVTLTSYGAELDNYLIENAGYTQLDWFSQDPATIVRDIIDLYQAQGGIVDYTSTSVENTNTVVTYTFNTATSLEGIKKSLELAPTDWFWYLDMRNNIVHFHPRPTTPRHTFVLGKHIKELDVEQYIDDITNVVYFSGGDTGGGNNLFLKYTDPTSETNYRRGLKLYSDNRVTLSSSADIIANSELERNSAPRYRSSVVIVDKVYDIESIQLGDLVAFRNFDNYVDDLEMQVVGIDYSPDAIRLQLDTLLPRVSKRLEDIKRNLDKQETLANPTAPS